MITKSNWTPSKKTTEKTVQLPSVELGAKKTSIFAIIVDGDGKLLPRNRRSGSHSTRRSCEIQGNGRTTSKLL